MLYNTSNEVIGKLENHSIVSIQKAETYEVYIKHGKIKRSSYKGKSVMSHSYDTFGFAVARWT